MRSLLYLSLLVELAAPLGVIAYSEMSNYDAPSAMKPSYGRISEEEFILTPSQIETFHREGCVTVPNVLSEKEVQEIESVFERFVKREIPVPGKDFCDMSRPFSTNYDEWSLVNCMLPTRYYPPFRNNIYERLTNSMAKQLFTREMTKDYDQFLNKKPRKVKYCSVFS